MHIANEIMESIGLLLQRAQSSLQKLPCLQISLSCNDGQEVFLVGQVLWVYSTKMPQKSYCQAENLYVIVLWDMYISFYV